MAPTTQAGTRALTFDGWVLTEIIADRGHEFEVQRGDEVKMLGVSRFHFNPTCERFAWLVRNGFPRSIQREGGVFTPLDDDDIDAAIAAELVAA